MTEKQIKNRVRGLVTLDKQADRQHIDTMYEVGKLINEIQQMRGYTNRLPAENEMSRILKGAGGNYGENYVRACWQLAFKVNDVHRRWIYKYELAVSDIIALVNMSMERITEILRQIKDGVIKKQVGNRGLHTYQIRLIEAPKRAGKRRIFDQNNVQVGHDPSILQAKVLGREGLDEDALTDLLANAISRFGEKAIRCWEKAMMRTGNITSVRSA